MVLVESTFKMKLSAIILLFLVGTTLAGCPAKKNTNKLICYYSKLIHVDACKCSHVILPADSDVKNVDRVREQGKGVKILISVNEFNQGLVDLLKSSKVDGIEINLKKLDSKNDINDFISTVRNRLGSDLQIVLSVPAKTEILAKYYDFKTLSKSADLFILQTAFLGASKNVTFHPSRLSGLWDMQNTDSVVDLVSGLGAPLSKLVITSPVQAFRFKLQSEKHTAPGSPALEVQSITRDELCDVMKNGANWTLERDQDQAGPYIFSKDQWIAFDDATSIDIKAKYTRVRGLAGMALKDLSQDGNKCESSLLDAAFQGLSRQARAPRGAVLHSLEREILETSARPLDTVQVSPYRISRVIDVEGNVHVIRKDTRTEFECSRQGYFVHPRSCGRFYRCVKFDQLSDEFSVFEFDCPAGLAFDNRVEVCVWPGSLPHASACSGSSEIAPVPRERFICPQEPGYYADPENCRWFFACLDHGKSPLSAYEFRCPFGLVYDESRLLCEWPWLVPKCGSGYAVASQVVYGGSVALEQYDGLEVLGVTALGGLHGPLPQQQPQVYSNVGLTTGGGHLSANAAQSLQNAGLLKGNLQGYSSGNLQGYSSGNLQGYSSGNRQGYASGNLQGYSSGNLQSYSSGNLQGYASGNLQGYSSGNLEGYSSGNLQGYSSGNLQGYSSGNVEGYSSGNLQGYSSGNLQGYSSGNLQGYSSGNLQGYSSGNLALKTTQTDNLGLVATDLSSNSVAANLNYQAGYAGTSNAQLVNSLADLSLKNAQYQANAGTSYSSGTNGNINIVGGGYSAVGVSSYGEDSNLVSHVTQSPVSVSTIPTVTAVPVPALNVASGFQSYQGGVVANVPELQYKISSHGNSGYQNRSTSFLNVVSSTPATGYSYPKPTVAFVEEPIRSTLSSGTSFVQHNIAVQPVVSTTQLPIVEKVVQPVVTTYQQPISVQKVQPVVTTYQKPVSFVQQKIQPVFVSTPAPAVVEKINLQPVVSTVGYDYPKPAIRFEESPVKATSFSFADISHSVSSTARPLTLVQQVQPQVHVVQQPQVHVVQQPQLQVYNVPSSTPKPLIVEQRPQVYVSSTPATVPVVQQAVSFQKHEIVQPQLIQQKVVQPAVVSSFSISSNSEGYHYEKPTIVFEEKPVVAVPKVQLTSYNLPSSTVVPIVKQPASFIQKEVVQPQIQVSSYIPVSTPKPVIVEQPQLYVSSTPAPIQPVSFSSFQKHETVQPVVQQKIAQPVSTFSISSNTGGYHYDKPSVAFEERPVVTYQKPVTTYSYQQPISTYTYKNVVQSTVNQGYNYPKPAIAFQEVPAVTRLDQKQVISSYNYAAPVKPAVVLQKQTPVVTSYTYTAPSTVRPAVVLQKQQPVVTSYTYQAPVVQQQPVVTSYTYTAPSTVKPAVVLQKQQAVVTNYEYSAPVQQQPVVTSYTYTAPSTVKPAVVLQKQQPVLTNYEYSAPVQQQPVVTSYYTYPKPVQQQPVVTSYTYTAPSTVKPAVVLQKQQPVFPSYTYTAPSTVKPAVLVQQPVTYIEATTPKTAVFLQKQPITYTSKPVVLKKQPAVVSSYSYTAQQPVQFRGYDYPKPAVPFVEQPVETYENRQPVEEVPFVKKKAYVTGGQSYQYQEYKPVVVENYQAPVVSTPKYQQYSVDSGYVYEKPVVPFEDTREYRPQIVSTTSRPVVNYKYVQSTPKPTFSSTINTIIEAKQPWTFYDSRLTSTVRPVQYSTSLPVVEAVTSSRPISRYSFGSFDEQYQEYAVPVVTTPRVVPVQVTTPRVEYVAPIRVTTPRVKVAYVAPRVKIPATHVLVTTSRPIAKYSFSSSDAQNQQNARVVENYVAPVEVQPSREYLPVTTSAPVVKLTTSLPVTREYLPPKSRVTPSREYLPVDEVSTVRPVKIVRVSRPKTIVKVNDFHPLLSAKLGAQCTCVSNAVKLRKKPLRIIVEEDDDDDGYIVDNDSTVVENYQYEPQKVDITPAPAVYVKSAEITPTPEVYIKSTTPVYIKSTTQAPPVYARKRVRVRPTVPLVTSTFRSVPEIQDTVVVNAVNDADATNIQVPKFDRYGPGGWRSRDEKLQGTIDCQRAGLFRHPTQCNKFYACRWDCTKNRFTLHVFNCPVHLTFDNNLGACNWPSQGPACLENTLLPSD